jgi:hypothetical protein
MKKTLLVLLALFTLGLSGCVERLDEDSICTQEDIDAIIDELGDSFAELDIGLFEHCSDKDIDSLFDRLEEAQDKETYNTLVVTIIRHVYTDTQYIEITHETYHNIITVTQFYNCIEECNSQERHIMMTKEDFKKWWTSQVEGYQNYIEVEIW